LIFGLQASGLGRQVKSLNRPFLFLMPDAWRLFFISIMSLIGNVNRFKVVILIRLKFLELGRIPGF
jgi:hypothetical protein